MPVLYRLGFLVLYCAVGIDVRAGSPPLPPRSAPYQVDSDQSHEAFKLDIMCNGRFSDGTMMGCRTYEDSNGTKVFMEYGTFDSAEKAKAEMQRSLRGAKKIIEQQRKTSLRQVIGERVVAMFVNYRTHEKYAAIILTRGSDYFQIQSSSLSVALQFEKWNFE